MFMSKAPAKKNSTVQFYRAFFTQSADVQHKNSRVLFRCIKMFTVHPIPVPLANKHAAKVQSFTKCATRFPNHKFRKASSSDSTTSV